MPIPVKICRDCGSYKLITGWRSIEGNVLQALVEKNDPNIEVILTICDECQRKEVEK